MSPISCTANYVDTFKSLTEVLFILFHKYVLSYLFCFYCFKSFQGIRRSGEISLVRI